MALTDVFNVVKDGVKKAVTPPKPDKTDKPPARRDGTDLADNTPTPLRAAKKTGTDDFTSSFSSLFGSPQTNDEPSKKPAKNKSKPEPQDGVIPDRKNPGDDDTTDPKVVVLDDFTHDDEEEGEPTHGEFVSATIRDYSDLEEDDIIQRDFLNKPHSRVDFSKSKYMPGSIESQVEGTIATFNQDTADEINDVREEKDKNGEDIRAINGSFGYSKTALYDSVLKNYYKQNPDAKGDKKIAQSIISRIDKTLAESDIIKKTGENFDNAVNDALDDNISVIFSAGNSGSGGGESDSVDMVEKKYGVDLPESASLDATTIPDNVIVVGATQANGTPSWTDDDVTDFSSKGKGPAGPDVAAPGLGVPTELGYFSGTSASAPVTTGLVADLIKANPDLSSKQINDILQDTAHDNPNNSPEEEGNGIIDRDAALKAARKAKPEDKRSFFRKIIDLLNPFG